MDGRAGCASLSPIIRRGAALMRRNVAFLTALLVAANGCSLSPLRPPPPNRSEYVISKGGGFLFSPEGGVVYGTVFALNRLMDKPAYVVALFENPEDGAPPLRTEVTIEPGNLEFQVKSPRLTILTNNRLYSVNLSLYSDDAHTQLLGVHRQQFLFSVPLDLKLRIEKEYGVRVL
jgi:hypothetical protein